MNKATDETAGQILTSNISKRVPPWDVRIFWGQNNNLPILGCQNPQKVPKISVIDETIRLKCDRQIENGKKYPKPPKFGQKGHLGGHVTHFWNFGTSLISRGWLKLETSNSAERWIAVSTNEKMQN